MDVEVVVVERGERVEEQELFEVGGLMLQARGGGGARGEFVVDVEVVEVHVALAHDGVVADELVVVRLGHDAELDEDLRLEGAARVELAELGGGVLEEHGHAAVDARLRDVVDGGERLVEAERVVVDLGHDFEGVGRDGGAGGEVGVGGREQAQVLGRVEEPHVQHLQELRDRGLEAHLVFLRHVRLPGLFAVVVLDADDRGHLFLDEFVDGFDQLRDFVFVLNPVRAHEVDHVQNAVHDFVLVSRDFAVAEEIVDELLHQLQVFNRGIFVVEIFSFVDRRLLQGLYRLGHLLVGFFVEDEVLDQRDVDGLDVVGDFGAVDEVVVHHLELVDVLEQLDRFVVAVEAQVGDQVDRGLHPLELLGFHDASFLVDDDFALAVHLYVVRLREELPEHFLVVFILGKEFDDFVLLTFDRLSLADT